MNQNLLWTQLTSLVLGKGKKKNIKLLSTWLQKLSRKNSCSILISPLLIRFRLDRWTNNKVKGNYITRSIFYHLWVSQIKSNFESSLRERHQSFYPVMGSFNLVFRCSLAEAASQRLVVWPPFTHTHLPEFFIANFFIFSSMF